MEGGCLQQCCVPMLMRLTVPSYMIIRHFVFQFVNLKLFDLGKLSKLKSGETLERVKIGGRGGEEVVKNQKSPKFQLGKVQN